MTEEHRVAPPDLHVHLFVRASCHTIYYRHTPPSCTRFDYLDRLGNVGGMSKEITLGRERDQPGTAVDD